MSLLLLVSAPARELPDSAGINGDSRVSFSINADIVSRYIWRGLPLSLSPNIQPYASISSGNLTIGTWASYGLSSPYAEIDLSVAYDLGPLTLALNDYYNEDETTLNLNDYFHFRSSGNSVSPHAVEGSVTFNATDYFPVSITAATFFLGNDRDEENNKYYSTYIEASYTLSLNDYEIRFMAGGTPMEGYYAGKAALVNVGFTASREIKITDAFTLPASLSLVVNPDANDIFLVFGLTF